MSDANRSITYTVSDIDTDFDVIEQISIVYTYTDSPIIYKFAEQSVPSSGEVDIVLSGT